MLIADATPVAAIEQPVFSKYERVFNLLPKKKTRGLPSPKRLNNSGSVKWAKRSMKILFWRTHPKAFKRMRAKQRVKEIRQRFSIPSGWASSPTALAVGRCESGNDYTKLSYHRDEKGRFYRGRWQMYEDTAAGFTGVVASFGRYADSWPAVVQDYVAYRLWSNSGGTFSRHWPQCGIGK